MPKDRSSQRCKTAARGPVATRGEEYKTSRVSRNAASHIETRLAFPTGSEFPIEDVWSIWKARLRAVTRGLNKHPHGHSSCGWVSGMPNTARTLYHRQSAVTRSCAHKLTLYIYCGPPCPFTFFSYLAPPPSAQPCSV